MWWPASSHRVYNAEFLGFIKAVAPSIFLGWMMKYILIRYGGFENVSRCDGRYSLGLVLGEMTCAGIWALIWNDNGRQHGVSNLAELKMTKMPGEGDIDTQHNRDQVCGQKIIPCGTLTFLQQLDPLHLLQVPYTKRQTCGLL